VRLLRKGTQLSLLVAARLSKSRSFKPSARWLVSFFFFFFFGLMTSSRVANLWLWLSFNAQLVAACPPA
jgi:hypothetical protein